MRPFLLSYRREDGDEVRPFDRLLRLRGIAVERDERFPGGGLVDEAVRGAIRSTAGAIPYLTRGFATSSYIREKELPWLIERRKDDPTYLLLPIFRSIGPEDIEGDPELGHLRALPAYLGRSISEFETAAPGAAAFVLYSALHQYTAEIRSKVGLTLRFNARGRAEWGPKEADVELDWLEFFGADGVAAPNRWQSLLMSALVDVRDAIDRTVGACEIRAYARISLATAFALGQTFPLTSGYLLKFSDRSGQLRDLGAKPAGEPLVVSEAHLDHGEDLALTVSLSQPAEPAADRYFQETGPWKVRLDLRAPELGRQSVAGDAHLAAITRQIEELVRRSRQEHQTKGMRICMAGPSFAAAALGTRLTRVGPIRFPDHLNIEDRYVETLIFG